MHVRIDAVDQTLPMDGSDVQNYLRISLPNGVGIRAMVSHEDLERLLGAQQGHPGIRRQQPAAPQPRPQPRPQPQFTPVEQPGGEMVMEFGAQSPVDVALQEPEPSAEVQVPMVDWTLLSDEQVSPNIKQILVSMGVPRVMPVVELTAIMDDISERMIQEAQMRNVQAQSYQQAPPQPRRPPVGHLQVNRPAPRRTVPKDELGYPMVRGHQPSYDPGEYAVLNPDADEDGISQM